MNDIIIKAPNSGRTAYRVVPDPDDPVILQLDGHLTRVLEISAAGFACPLNVVKAGRRYPFNLDLPTARRPLSGYVDMLPDKDQDQLQGLFVDLSADEQDRLHQYVLIRQKSVLREMSAGK